MMRVLHISDTHFGTEREPVVHALHALADTLRPDLVVLGGDITQRARRGQFAAARRFIQALQRPVLAVPGNHDIPLFNLAARLFDPYGNYRRALGAVLEPVYEDDRLLAIGVNSTRAARRKNGEVSRTQAQRVAQRLRDARPGQLRVVALHHPVHAMVESDQRNLLIGREFAVPAWVDAGVDLILGGHIHLPYVAPLHGKAGEAGRRAWTAGGHGGFAARAGQGAQLRQPDRLRGASRQPGLYGAALGFPDGQRRVRPLRAAGAGPESRARMTRAAARCRCS